MFSEETTDVCHVVISYQSLLHSVSQCV